MQRAKCKAESVKWVGILAFSILHLQVPILFAAGLEEFFVAVDPGVEIGPVKDMHAVNNGPSVKKLAKDDQMRGNFDEYRALRTPFARTHDSINCVPGGAHAVDITAVFPDFDADENDPKNYDFTFTDEYLNTIRAAGTEVFFRLGQTIEHGTKKYGIYPPKDFAKWARVCEHIIRHYNEGWGWEMPEAYRDQFKVRYWEIWNEPDLGHWMWQTNPRTWAGTGEQFDEFYTVAAKHLKGKFPHLKIGGPALAGDEAWGERFIAHCKTNSVPLDFFSWHVYSVEPSNVAEKAARMRKLLDKYGFEKSESILNEWNYVKGWTGDYVYSADAICGENNLKGAAFTAAVMSSCQDAPVDMLMYYDARISTIFNGLFDRVRLYPLKAYYAIYAWSRMKDYGTQVKATAPEGKGLYATAVKGKDGKVAMFLVRYSSDNNVTSDVKVKCKIENVKCKMDCVRAHLTDLVRSYTEVPLMPDEDGAVTIKMQPLSYALVEF
ncbi:MAG: hypothetical protein IJG84_15980 [Kiritimatiellae bacterium]|nr:hypothetical protein [Kiritimatiellia bacterium]